MASEQAKTTDVRSPGSGLVSRAVLCQAAAVTNRQPPGVYPSARWHTG